MPYYSILIEYNRNIFVRPTTTCLIGERYHSNYIVSVLSTFWDFRSKILRSYHTSFPVTMSCSTASPFCSQFQMAAKRIAASIHMGTYVHLMGLQFPIAIKSMERPITRYNFSY